MIWYILAYLLMGFIVASLAMIINEDDRVPAFYAWILLWPGAMIVQITVFVAIYSPSLVRWWVNRLSKIRSKK